jgi:hypothetical protein
MLVEIYSAQGDQEKAKQAKTTLDSLTKPMPAR